VKAKVIYIGLERNAQKKPKKGKRSENISNPDSGKCF
jgi:hypothetical protein